MSEARVRVLHVIVQPVLVLDDGTELRPGPQMTPVTVPLSELAKLEAEITEAVRKAQPPTADA